MNAKKSANVWKKKKSVASVSDRFMVGDHVIWNSEAGHVSGGTMSEPTEDAEPDRWRIRPDLPPMWQEFASTISALVAAGWRRLLSDVTGK
jgi:hypothetical protein